MNPEIKEINHFIRNIPWTDSTCKFIGRDVIFVGSSSMFKIESIFPKEIIEPIIIADKDLTKRHLNSSK